MTTTPQPEIDNAAEIYAHYLVKKVVPKTLNLKEVRSTAQQNV